MGRASTEARTVFVGGVAMTPEQKERLNPHSAGL